MYVGILPTQQQVCWSTKWVKRPDCSFWAHINKLCHPESTKGVAPTVSKTSAENLGCWHSGTPSWTELRRAGKDNNSEKGEPNLKIPFLSLRYFAYFESENVASFFTYTTPDHKSDLNTASKDSEKLMIGLREHFLLPPSIEVTFAHLFLVN